MPNRAHGYNPMRWSCDERGCYNLKHRPKIEMFADIWPGRISMGDVDGIVEIAGNALMLEWKSNEKEIPAGQRIMYRRITNGKRVTVLCVAGNAESMEVASYKLFYDGREIDWRKGSLEALRERMKSWCMWAQGNPKIGG